MIHINGFSCSSISERRLVEREGGAGAPTPMVWAWVRSHGTAPGTGRGANAIHLNSSGTTQDTDLQRRNPINIVGCVMLTSGMWAIATTLKHLLSSNNTPNNYRQRHATG